MTKITRNLLYIAGLVLMLAMFGCGNSGTSTTKPSKANIAIKAATEDGDAVVLEEVNLQVVAGFEAYVLHDMQLSAIKLDSSEPTIIDSLSDNEFFLFRALGIDTEGNRYAGQTLAKITGENTPVAVTCIPYTDFSGFEGNYSNESGNITVQADSNGIGDFGGHLGSLEGYYEGVIYFAPTTTSGKMGVVGLLWNSSSHNVVTATGSAEGDTIKLNAGSAGTLTFTK